MAVKWLQYLYGETSHFMVYEGWDIENGHWGWGMVGLLKMGRMGEYVFRVFIYKRKICQI